MNDTIGKVIVGVVGALTVLGACAITTSATPLWALLLIPFMMEQVD